MKNVLMLACLSILITSCNKSSNNNPTTVDASAPVITLNGSTNDTMSLNSTYSDPGANATDDTDGNISGQVAVSGTINKDLVGEYRLYYNVKDAAGNSAVQLTRYVYVQNDADYLVGTYNATENCGASATGNMPTPTNLTVSNTVNNKISFGMVGNVSTVVPDFIVNGNTITAPLKISGAGSFVGNGVIAANKLSFTMTFTAVSGNAFQGTWNCTNNYIKQ